MRSPLLAALGAIASLASVLVAPPARAQEATQTAIEETAIEETPPPAPPAPWGSGDDDEIPAREIRVLPMDPCLRLTLALSELDRQEARASCLASTRLTNREDRIDEGVVLLGFGLLSAIAGGATAVVGANDGDELLLAAGLDVFYVATGLLLWVLGREAEPEERWLEGYGLAMTVQGAALLVYDGVTWAFAADRASRMRSLLRE